METADAVRVVGVRFGIPLFFAVIMGNTHTDVSREAIAQFSPACGGIWGLQGIDVPGNIVTDSYDSIDGPYSVATGGEEGDPKNVTFTKPPLKTPTAIRSVAKTSEKVT